MNAPKPPKVSKKVSKSLTIEQRVDLLIREGVDHPEKWATIHGYEDPNDPVVANDPRAQVEWQRLRIHHLEETNFLFDIIRELVKRNDMLDEQLANVIMNSDYIGDD